MSPFRSALYSPRHVLVRSIARTLLALTAVFVCASIVAAGQRGGGAAQTAPSALKTRVLEYWARRQSKDLVGAYPFYCASYRSRVSLRDFTALTRLNRFDLSEIAVAAIAQDKERYHVTIMYRFVAPMITQDRLDGHATEDWQRDANGRWCKIDEPPALPFPGPRGFDY